MTKVYIPSVDQDVELDLSFPRSKITVDDLFEEPNPMDTSFKATIWAYVDWFYDGEQTPD